MVVEGKKELKKQNKTKNTDTHNCLVGQRLPAYFNRSGHSNISVTTEWLGQRYLYLLRKY